MWDYAISIFTDGSKTETCTRYGLFSDNLDIISQVAQYVYSFSSENLRNQFDSKKITQFSLRPLAIDICRQS